LLKAGLSIISILGTPLPNERQLSGRVTDMDTKKPVTRPDNACFSSGPCAKNPFFDLTKLAKAPLGRSHRAAVGKARLKLAIEETRKILEIPSDYRIAIVPASDTGAVEMAMWSMLGARAVTMVAWESFGDGWVNDVVKQLRLDAKIFNADYGDIVNMENLDFDTDIVFTWNGTTSGVCLKDGNAIPHDRLGLTICDATSAAFAMDLPWVKLDVTTFSWQKVLGGEAAHGMLILSPRAAQRLENYTPSWPVPKIFRLTKNGKLIESIFEGATINTPSMLAVEDYLLSLEWAKRVGGKNELINRAKRNAEAIWDFCDSRDWIENLAINPSTRSTTSVCLKFKDNRITDGHSFANKIAKRLENEKVAFDIGAYRDAPPGLRIWCGSTVETSDIEKMLPWIDWAFHEEIKASC
jgi:phosphoserine aminotransferase